MAGTGPTFTANGIHQGPLKRADIGRRPVVRDRRNLDKRAHREFDADMARETEGQVPISCTAPHAVGTNSRVGTSAPLRILFNEMSDE